MVAYMAADMKVHMVADMAMYKVADMVADKKERKISGRHGVGHGLSPLDWWLTWR